MVGRDDRHQTSNMQGGDLCGGECGVVGGRGGGRGNRGDVAQSAERQIRRAPDAGSNPQCGEKDFIVSKHGA